MELASKYPVVHKAVDLLDIGSDPIKARAFPMAIDEADDLIAKDPVAVSRDYIAATGKKFEPSALAEMIGRKGNLYATGELEGLPLPPAAQPAGKLTIRPLPRSAIRATSPAALAPLEAGVLSYGANHGQRCCNRGRGTPASR